MEIKRVAAILLSLCTLAVSEDASDTKLLDPKTVIISPGRRSAAVYEAIVPRNDYYEEEYDKEEDDETDYPTIDVVDYQVADLSMAPDIVAEAMENLLPISSKDEAVTINEIVDPSVSIDGITELLDTGVTSDVGGFRIDEFIIALQLLFDKMIDSYLHKDFSVPTYAQTGPTGPIYNIAGIVNRMAAHAWPRDIGMGGTPQSYPFQQQYGVPPSPFVSPPGYPPMIGPPVPANAYPPLQNSPHQIYGAPSSTVGGTLSGFPHGGMVPFPSSPISTSGMQQTNPPFGTLRGIIW